MLLALSITIGALIFAALIFAALFRNLDPAVVAVDYKQCAGGWHEAYLNHCAAGLTKIPQQPVNTYTNLAYLAAGLFVALTVDTPPAQVFAATMIYLSIGSTLYHALSTRWAGMLDVTAIYATFSALAVYALFVLLGIPDWITTGIMFVVAGLTAFLLSKRYSRNMHLIIGIFLGAAYAFLLLHMARTGRWSVWPYLAGSFSAFALAFLIWNMDRAGTFPLKRWGHGCWHILTAAASALVFYAIFLTR